jgi:hypothetical protein
MTGRVRRGKDNRVRTKAAVTNSCSLRRCLTCRQNRSWHCTQSGGRSRSTSRTAYQAHSCIESPFEIKVSSKALLQLAYWCRQQQAASIHPEQGGSSCSHASPPAPNDRSAASSDHSSLGTTLDAAATDQAARTPGSTEPDSRSAADSSNGQGGDR